MIKYILPVILFLTIGHGCSHSDTREQRQVVPEYDADSPRAMEPDMKSPSEPTQRPGIPGAGNMRDLHRRPQ